MKIRLEWKPQDCWIGVFWRNHEAWICVVPMLPIHIWWGREGATDA